MATVTLELPADVADELLKMPEQERNNFATAALRVGGAFASRPLTASEVLALPPDVQDKIMEAQAAAFAPYYEADLALPPGERELTAFTALDGVDPVLEPDEYLNEH